MDNSDLGRIQEFVKEYKKKEVYRYSNGDAALEVSSLENEIASIVAKNPDNKEIVIEGVHADGMLLECASERLKNDPLVVLVAMKNNPKAAKFVKDPVVLKQVRMVIDAERHGRKSPRTSK